MSTSRGHLRWAPGNGRTLAFLGTSGSRHAVLFDTGEGAESASPVEALLLALGACTGMDVIDILRKQRQRVVRYEIVVEADRADHVPKVATAFRLRHIVRGESIDPDAVRRAVALSREKYCTVGLMLGKAAPIEDTIEILEEAMPPA